MKSVSPKDFNAMVGPTTPVPPSALELFQLFFSVEILQHICDETNRYAVACSSTIWEPLTITELKAWMGFSILMGLVRIPALSDYWSKNPIFNYQPVASRITRTQFFNITKYLHFTDNSLLAPSGTPGYRKLGKIEPMLLVLGEKFKSMYNLHREVSIDEAMVPFKGRSSMKQYMPMKPVKRGFKVWMLADAHTGYVTHLDVYTGKAGDGPTDGLGASVVKSLCQDITHK